MSGNNRQSNRSVTGKFKQTNTSSRVDWKPKPKIKVSLDSASCSQKDTGAPVVENVTCDVQNVKSIEALLDGDSISKNVNEYVDKDKKKDDVARGMTNIKSVEASLDEDCISKKGKQFADKNKDENNDHTSSITPFDICPKKVNTGVKLKAPLHVKNRERRNQSRQSTKGPNVVTLRPGMVLMKKYISCDDQISIVKKCRELGVSDGGFYQPVFRGGTKLHLKMMCLGKNWDPESNKYDDTRPSDNAKPPEIPDLFHDIVEKALQDSNYHIQENVPSMKPDICIVNFYLKSGRLGLHQDKDESAKSLKQGLPVVSFSIGNSAEFLYGDDRDVEKAEKVTLESGDVLIFGGKSRHIFHGVTSILPDTAPTLMIEATDMCPGRLNLTFRTY